MKTREPIWWVPLVWRMLGWGAGLAVTWGTAAFLVFEAGLSFWAHLPPMGMTLADLALKIARASIISAVPYAILGALVGAVTAFCAPPNEPQHPLKSEFLRVVIAQTLKFWALSCIVIWIGLAVLISLFYALVSFGALQIVNFTLVRAALGLSLWLALTRALRATKL